MMTLGDAVQLVEAAFEELAGRGATLDEIAYLAPFLIDGSICKLDLGLIVHGLNERGRDVVLHGESLRNFMTNGKKKA